ncbi:MAG: hypothetical protein ACK4HF_17050 [Paracoccaceae bacterium]
MKLILSPIRTGAVLEAQVRGDMLELNGETLDFGTLPKGSVLTREAVGCDWIAGDVSRAEDGRLTVPLLLPHGAEAPPETLFPQPIDAEDGPVPLPPYAIGITGVAEDR